MAAGSGVNTTLYVADINTAQVPMDPEVPLLLCLGKGCTGPLAEGALVERCLALRP